MSDVESGASRIPLVFHFTGNLMPSWGMATLKQAIKRWPGRIVFLHDQNENPRVRGVDSVDIREWYSKQPFEEFAEKFARPTNFRGGFWYHAVERFFVLSQWAKRFEVSRLLHTELDVVLFNGNQLETQLSKLPHGLFFPRASPQNAGANLLYIHGHNALHPLVQFFSDNGGVEYEMGLLARFLDEFPKDGSSLPSHFDFASEFPSFGRKNRISLEQLGGVIDVHPIGTWILGQDPRNESEVSIFNHFFYHNIGSQELADLKYRHSIQQKQLFVRKGSGPEWPVFALHVHSKLVPLASTDWIMAVLARLANQKFRTLLVPQHLEKYPARFFKATLDYFYLKLLIPTRAAIKRISPRPPRR